MRGVEPVGERGGEGDADMGELADQEQDQENVEDQAHGRHDDRRSRVLAREEGRRQDLDEHIGGQADREGGESTGGGRGRMRVEGAALEQHMDDRAGDGDKRRRGGQRQQEAELDGPCSATVGPRPHRRS